MIEIEQALREFLITNISTVDKRVFHAPLPSGKQMPCLTYQHVQGGSRSYTHSGVSGLVVSRFQIDCWSDKYSQVKTVSREILRVLDGFAGYMGSRNPVKVGPVFMDEPYDLYNPEVPLQHIVHTALIWHAEEA